MAWGGLNELNEWGGGGVNRKDPNSAPPPSTTDLTHLPPLIEPVPPFPSLPSTPLPSPSPSHSPLPNTIMDMPI